MIENLNLIVSVGLNNEIGKDNKLLWKYKEDMLFFKNITLNNTIIMGYNTYKSMPKLLNRKYIIITNKNISNAMHSKEEVLNYILNTKEKCFIIGGEQIYKEFIDYCKYLYITEINDTKNADKYFPIIDKTKYKKEIINTYTNYSINKYTRCKMKKLIVIEGACDGIGKSTQYELLLKSLKEKNIEVISHHFPSYNTYQGYPVEMYLKGKYGNKEELSPYFVNSLYAIDRAITWNELLKNEYDNDKTIVLDRYTTSSLIYQSAYLNDNEKKEFIDYVCDFEYNKLGIKKPDLVIFLYAPYDMVEKLRNERKQNDGVVNDIHERDSIFMRKVYDNAMFIADYLGWNKVKCFTDDKFKSIDEIHNDIIKIVESSN